MLRTARGHAVVEFALCIPVVLALFFAPIQVLRLWYRQFSLERLAFDVARALGAEGGDAPHLLAVATALAGGGTAVTVGLRTLQPPLPVPGRRARTWEAVDVTLSQPATLGFPFPSSLTCRADATELRLRSLP